MNVLGSTAIVQSTDRAGAVSRFAAIFGAPPLHEFQIDDRDLSVLFSPASRSSPDRRQRSRRSPNCGRRSSSGHCPEFNECDVILTLFSRLSHSWVAAAGCALGAPAQGGEIRASWRAPRSFGIKILGRTGWVRAVISRERRSGRREHGAESQDGRPSGWLYTWSLAGKHRSTVGKMAGKYKTVIDTPAGPRKCLQLVIERDRGRKPLVARFGGIPLRRVRTAALTDQRPVMASAKRNELIHRLLAGRCELCEGTEGLEVHHVRKLADLNKPGRREKPPWMELMAKRRRKTLITCLSAAATRTSTLAGQRSPTRNDHWRAGCEETCMPCSGRDRRKRTRPRAGGCDSPRPLT